MVDFLGEKRVDPLGAPFSGSSQRVFVGGGMICFRAMATLLPGGIQVTIC